MKRLQVVRMEIEERSDRGSVGRAERATLNQAGKKKVQWS